MHECHEDHLQVTNKPSDQEGSGYNCKEGPSYSKPWLHYTCHWKGEPQTSLLFFSKIKKHRLLGEEAAYLCCFIRLCVFHYVQYRVICPRFPFFFVHPLISVLAAKALGGAGIRCACLKICSFSSMHWGPPTHMHPAFCLDQLPLTSPSEAGTVWAPQLFFSLFLSGPFLFYFLHHSSSFLSNTDRGICLQRDRGSLEIPQQTILTFLQTTTK